MAIFCPFHSKTFYRSLGWLSHTLISNSVLRTFRFWLHPSANCHWIGLALFFRNSVMTSRNLSNSFSPTSQAMSLKAFFSFFLGLELHHLRRWYGWFSPLSIVLFIIYMLMMFLLISGSQIFLLSSKLIYGSA